MLLSTTFQLLLKFRYFAVQSHLLVLQGLFKCGETVSKQWILHIHLLDLFLQHEHIAGKLNSSKVDDKIIFTCGYWGMRSTVEATGQPTLLLVVK